MASTRTLAAEPIVVLGALGGGAHVLVKALNAVGVYFGTEKKASKWSSTGADGEDWSVRELQAINQRCFAEFGLGQNQAGFLPDDWREWPAAPIIGNAITDILHAKFSGCQRWGWSEPATSLLAPIYREVLCQSGVETPLFLICVRNPATADVYRNQRDFQEETPDDRTIGLWVRYNLNALAGTKGARRQVIAFDALKSDPEGTFRNILNSVSSWQPTEGEVAEAITCLTTEISKLD